MVDEVISHYKITSKLGSGGMGVVYKAEDIDLKRTVALKFLPPLFSSDTEARKRFTNEARAASALDHPNICTVHEIGQTGDGSLFIAMACYEGETLKEKINKGPLKVDEAIKITLQICEGLEKAHKNGIIHRDIKPANIFITNEGTVKILDFGLAKVKGLTQLTLTETTAGTLNYMSPEQAKGEEVGQRSDIWSLGIVLYEAVTGTLPFNADYDQAIIYSILNENPDLSKIPKELIPVLEKSINKSLKERYQKIEEVIAYLRIIQNKSGDKKHPKIIRKRHFYAGTRTKVVLISLLAAVIAVLSIYFFEIGKGSNTQITSELHKKMIVVLPFENLGPSNDNYFAEGIRDEISNKLSSFASIGVISRSSAEKYAKSNKTAKEIGKELGVDYVLEGTIHWAKGYGKESRVKIFPQLVRVSDDINVWSDSYDRILKDIFEVQNEIAQTVVNKLDGSLISDRIRHVNPPTQNMGAYDLYLKALAYENSWYIFKKDFQKRIELYKKAVELDPNFALAYAHLSLTMTGMYVFYFDRNKNVIKEAFDYAEKAYQLNANLAECYLALGNYYRIFERNDDKALKEFIQATRINPNCTDAFMNIGSIYSAQGNYKLAVLNFTKSSFLNPLGDKPLFSLAETYRVLKDFKNAEKYYKRLIEMKPELAFPKAQLAELYVDWKGDVKTASKILYNVKAIDEDYYNYAYTVSVYLDELNRDYDSAIKKLIPLNKDTVNELMGYTLKKLEMGFLYRYKGDTKLSRAYFDSTRVQISKMLKRDPKDMRWYGMLGIAHAGLGNKEKAIAAAEKDAKSMWRGEVHYFNMIKIYLLLKDYDNALLEIDSMLSGTGSLTLYKLRLDPLFDPLRNLPGYKAIIEKYKDQEG